MAAPERVRLLTGAFVLASIAHFLHGLSWNMFLHLPGFLKANPGVTINLATRLRPFDFAEEGMDAAIHFGSETWPDALSVSAGTTIDWAVVGSCSVAQGLRKSGTSAGTALKRLSVR